jgi:hypothetical protein
MAEATAPSKPLFRRVDKCKKVKIKSKVREREEEEEEEAVATTEATLIQSTKKKRKVLNTVLYKRGLDSRATLQATKQEETEELKAPLKTTDPDRLRTFSGGTGPNNEISGAEGVLQQKHKQALEEFIQKNLAKDDVKTQGKIDEKSKSDVKDLESKLYEELASTAAQLSGAGPDSKATKEEDVGSGGAMLGGTGLAEVILPVDARMDNVKATEEARMKRQQQQKGVGVVSSAVDVSMLPTSFSVGKGKKERRQRAILATKGDQKDEPDDLPASFSQNFSQQRRMQRQAEQAAKTTESITADAASAVDSERIGFEAARRFDLETEEAGGGTSSSAHHHKASDTRVFRDFVRTQRERGL